MHRIPELLKGNALVGLAIVGPLGEFIDCNDKLCEVLGYTKDRLKDLTFQEISHPQDLNPSINPYREVISGAIKSFSLVKRYKHGQTGEYVICNLQTEGFYDESSRFLYFFSQVMPVTGLLSLAQDRQLDQIKTAIAQNEFVLYYQPIVNLASGVTQGYEALARWKTDSGILSPNEFIPLLRLGHAEHLLCYWVIDEIIRVQPLVDRWLSFNIAPKTIARDDWSEHPLPPGSHLEILESEAVSSLVQGRIKEARANGVKITLDDFGTGYCSIERLLDGDVDFVKLDQSIIQQLPSVRAKTTCRAAIGLAHELNIEVIAEGVETNEQAEILLAAECDMCQGYLFGKPGPLAKVTGQSSDACI